MSLLTPTELLQRVTSKAHKDAESDERCVEWACSLLWSEASQHITNATLDDFDNGIFRPYKFHVPIFRYRTIDATLCAKISTRINERAKRLGWAFTLYRIESANWLCVELRALPVAPAPPIYT